MWKFPPGILGLLTLSLASVAGDVVAPGWCVMSGTSPFGRPFANNTPASNVRTFASLYLIVRGQISNLELKPSPRTSSSSRKCAGENTQKLLAARTTKSASCRTTSNWRMAFFQCVQRGALPVDSTFCLSSPLKQTMLQLVKFQKTLV